METRGIGTYSRVEAWTRTADKRTEAAGPAAGADPVRMRTRTLGFSLGKLGVRYVSQVPDRPAAPEAGPDPAAAVPGPGGQSLQALDAGHEQAAQAGQAAGWNATADARAAAPGTPGGNFPADRRRALRDAAAAYGSDRAGATFPNALPDPAGVAQAPGSGPSLPPLPHGLASYRRAMSARLDAVPRMLDGVV